MLFRKQSALAALSMLCVFALALTGCDGGGSNSVANIRVFNGLIGSPTAGGVNVSLRQPTAVSVNPTPIAFGGVSPARRVSSDNAQDTYLFLGNSASSISVQKFDYPADNVSASTTGELLVATGVAGQTSGDAAPKLIYVRTSIPLSLIRNGSAPTANALIRLVNASPGSPAVYLSNEQSGVAAPVSGLSGVTFGNYSSGDNTSSNYATVTAATYHFAVRNSQGNAVLADLPNVVLQPGNAYTLIVYGSTNTAYGAPVAATFIQDYPLQ